MNRILSILFALASLIIIFASQGLAQLYPQPIIGLYSDEGHSSSSVNNLEGSTLFDLWVWVSPGEHGIFCADYKLDIPNDMIPQSVEINPENGIYMGEAYGSPGFSICFYECQTDWIWTTKIQILLTDRIERYITLSDHEYTGEIIVANCLQGYPIEQLFILNRFYVNTSLPPVLVGSEVAGPSSLVAIFDRKVVEDDMYSIEVTPENISIFEKANPSIHVEVISVQIRDGEEYKLDIRVGSIFDAEKEYTITTTHLCAKDMRLGGWGHPVCGDSEIDFSGTISTKTATWGAIKSLIK